MAVMTRRCTLSGHSAGMMMPKQKLIGGHLTQYSDAHACGRQPSVYSRDGVNKGCMSLLEMAQLLIKLGADATAVHPSRGCLLAIAASAGEAGLWDLLV